MTHICVIKLTVIGSDNGMSPEQRQAIIWTNAGILLIWPLGTNFNEILVKIPTIFIQENVFENVVCETAAILSRPQCVKPLRPEQNGQQFADIFKFDYWRKNWILIQICVPWGAANKMSAFV